MLQLTWRNGGLRKNRFCNETRQLVGSDGLSEEMACLPSGIGSWSRKAGLK